MSRNLCGGRVMMPRLAAASAHADSCETVRPNFPKIAHPFIAFIEKISLIILLTETAKI